MATNAIIKSVAGKKRPTDLAPAANRTLANGQIKVVRGNLLMRGAQRSGGQARKRHWHVEFTAQYGHLQNR